MAIPNQTITTHHIGETKAKFKAGMRAEDFPHLAELLINLYSDPIAAIIREYATNALDSHIDAGLVRPIEVTLPSVDSLEFIVQDYGVGLSIDDLENVYSMYGRSTKRGSNAVTGKLGLGCKSGLTYCDAFTITAVKDGVKCVAISTKDEHGVGEIQVIDTVGTNEPNGVRIAIPVDRWDVNNFRHTADRLFQFWEPGTVLVDGEAPEVPEWRKQAMAIDDDTFVIPLGTDTGLYSSYVIEGNVAYEVDDATIPGKGRNRDRSMRFVARVNMSDIDIVPSREAVMHTPWTDETLSDLNDYIATNFDRVLATRLAEAGTRWEETQLKVLWRGSGTSLNASQATPIWDYDPNGYHRQAKAHTSYRYQLLANTRTMVVTKFTNKTLATAHRNRLKEFAPDCKSFVIIPEGVNAAALDGRDNVYEWAEILVETEPEKDPVTGKRVKRDETRYTVVGGNPMTAAELAKISKTGDKVLLLQPNQSLPQGDFGATCVRMYSCAQEGRLKRLVPGIKDYNQEVREQRAKIEKAVTDYDRKLYAAQQLDRSYRKFDADAIDDEYLAETIRLANAPTTKTLSDALGFGIQIIPSDLVSGANNYVNKRYPLISSNRHYYGGLPDGDDVYLYINAKHAAIVVQEAAQEATEAVAS